MAMVESPMHAAFAEAQLAYEAGEVPVGAVVVGGGRIIGRGHNLIETLADPTAHAEMLAITAATNYLGGKFLDQCALYVTLEPCPMCAGAILWARVGELHYGAPDPRRGYTRYSPSMLHPSTRVYTGDMAAECARLMRSFFRARREKW